MKKICTIVGVYGKTGVCLPMTQGQALSAAAGRDVNFHSEHIEYQAFTPPPKWVE
ncbi:MAG: hypothetical protein LBR18_06630 [Tannerella sp.]|jgi:hypothetical protein|nr:hypothetical protein [Tannerella sp.]